MGIHPFIIDINLGGLLKITPVASLFSKHHILGFDGLICIFHTPFTSNVYFHTTAILGQKGFLLIPHGFLGFYHHILSCLDMYNMFL
jgi:hypothetical protein